MCVALGDRTEVRLNSVLKLAQFQRGVGAPVHPWEPRFYRHYERVKADIKAFGERFKRAA